MVEEESLIRDRVGVVASVGQHEDVFEAQAADGDVGVVGVELREILLPDVESASEDGRGGDEHYDRDGEGG